MPLPFGTLTRIKGAANVIKFLYAGDKHFRGTNPRSRTDDYKAALFAKIREIFELAKKHQVDAILCPGDTFDTHEVAISVLLEVADLYNESPVPIYTTAGNHDIPGYNISAYHRTSLHLLERLVPHLHVTNDPSKPTVFEKTGVRVQLTFTPYTGKMDVDGYGYSPEVDVGPDYFKIHVAHGMLLDHVPPFDKYTLVQDVQTTADLVLCGHDHTGFGVFYRRDGKVFVNNGAVPRMAASVEEMQRQITAALITVTPSTKAYTGGCLQPIQLLPLESAKPGQEVLDRSQIEANKARQYAMEQFAALIDTGSGEALLDVNAIVEQIAANENLAPEIVRLALEKIDAAREKVV
jgi:DNA repair protein SbcD/Mre11